jgi:hypothetical protein
MELKDCHTCMDGFRASNLLPNLWVHWSYQADKLVRRRAVQSSLPRVNSCSGSLIVGQAWYPTKDNQFPVLWMGHLVQNLSKILISLECIHGGSTTHLRNLCTENEIAEVVTKWRDEILATGIEMGHINAIIMMKAVGGKSGLHGQMHNQLQPVKPWTNDSSVYTAT